ncbi:hypothetical protein CAOG_006191 [Capsaspora owczarzaki ATCC 30864]|uniref:Vesicle transport protein n=2 Tax=Capsaspora owczarzaki (strain ATCC 30864) TaxID=595528 RepID=A0A0D2WUS9_CAPO3|nr:hypothetical protein CAOG_006191 [Capsaspora owczarzaki ATCC 30864]
MSGSAVGGGGGAAAGGSRSDAFAGLASLSAFSGSGYTPSAAKGNASHMSVAIPMDGNSSSSSSGFAGQLSAMVFGGSNNGASATSTQSGNGTSTGSNASSASNDDASFVLGNSALYGGSNESCMELSRTQRAIGFVLFLAAGAFCFALSFLYTPMLILKARQFALMFSLGSVFVLTSFFILVGPVTQSRRLIASERAPFTAFYFFTLFITIYSALIWQSFIYTIVFAGLQVAALVWYVISFVPGGSVGLKILGRFTFKAVRTTAQAVLPR